LHELKNFFQIKIDGDAFRFTLTSAIALTAFGIFANDIAVFSRSSSGTFAAFAINNVRNVNLGNGN